MTVAVGLPLTTFIAAAIAANRDLTDTARGHLARIDDPAQAAAELRKHEGVAVYLRESFARAGLIEQSRAAGLTWA